MTIRLSIQNQLSNAMYEDRTSDNKTDALPIELTGTTQQNW